MIISLNRRYVFVHIHKCAGTSIEIALSKTLRHNDLVFGSTKSGEKHQEFFRRAIGLNKHSTALEARRFLGEEYWARSFKFAFVRHPVARLRSLYHYALKLADSTPLTDEERHVFQTQGKLPDHAPYRYKAVKAALKSGSFSDFAQHPLTWQDSGAQPQWQSVCDDSGQLIVDFIGKVESIEQDWQVLEKRLEIEAPLDVKNSSGDRASEELSAAALELITQKYERDFALFDYQPAPVAA